MKNLIEGIVLDEEGQDLIEYALLAGFMSLAVVSAMNTLGAALNGFYGNVQTKVNDAAS